MGLFLVLGDQPAGPRVRAVVGREPLDVTGGRILVPVLVRDKMISASGCALKRVSTCPSSTVNLCAAAICSAPLLDMIRYEPFLLLRRECLRRHPEMVTSSAAELYVINGTVRACK